MNHDNGAGWLPQGPNKVLDNVFASNGATGVLAQYDGRAGSLGVVISGNAFGGNGFSPGGTTNLIGQIVNDGVHVSVTGQPATLVTVANNLTIRNADYGIEAPGVTDGGGNFAAANGNPAQCVGVVCRTFRGF